MNWFSFSRCFEYDWKRKTRFQKYKSLVWEDSRLARYCCLLCLFVQLKIEYVVAKMFFVLLKIHYCTFTLLENAQIGCIFFLFFLHLKIFLAVYIESVYSRVYVFVSVIRFVLVEP